MPSITFTTPLGWLTVEEAESRITAISKGRPGQCDKTSLLESARDQLNAYFDGRLKEFDLPLAPAGTEFEQAVWDAMCRIPYGKTRSYGAVAMELSSTARSVGQACATNPIPIVIPCHRIVGADGKMVGYSGFQGRISKEFLLGLEGAMTQSLPFGQTHT